MLVAPAGSSVVAGRYQVRYCDWKGWVIAVGGCDAWNCLSMLQYLDPALGVWRALPRMATPRRGAAVVVLAGNEPDPTFLGHVNLLANACF